MTLVLSPVRMDGPPCLLRKEAYFIAWMRSTIPVRNHDLSGQNVLARRVARTCSIRLLLSAIAKKDRRMHSREWAWLLKASPTRVPHVARISSLDGTSSRRIMRALPSFRRERGLRIQPISLSRQRPDGPLLAMRGDCAFGAAKSTLRFHPHAQANLHDA